MSMHDDIERVLVSEEQLKAKVAELGAQISKDYEGKNLVLVSILKGSVVFMHKMGIMPPHETEKEEAPFLGLPP